MNNFTMFEDYIQKCNEHDFVNKLILKLEDVMENKDKMSDTIFMFKSNTLLKLITNTYPEYAQTNNLSMEGIGDSIVSILKEIWKQINKAWEWLKQKALDVWSFLITLFTKKKDDIAKNIIIITNLSTDDNYKAKLDELLEEKGLKFGDKISDADLMSLRKVLASRLDASSYVLDRIYILVTRDGALADPMDVMDDITILLNKAIRSDSTILQAMTVNDSTPTKDVIGDLGRFTDDINRWLAYLEEMVVLTDTYVNNIKAGKEVSSDIDNGGVAYSKLTMSLLSNKEYFYSRMGLGNSCLAIKMHHGIGVVKHSRSNKKYTESDGKPITKLPFIPLFEVAELSNKLPTDMVAFHTRQQALTTNLSTLMDVSKKLADKVDTENDNASKNVLAVTRVVRELVNSNTLLNQNASGIYSGLEKLVIGALGNPIEGETK